MVKVAVGSVFGKWTVIDGPFDEGKKNGGRFWHCICECSTESLVRNYDLYSGKSTQCRVCAANRPHIINRDRKYAKIPHRKRLLAIARNAVDRCTRITHKRYNDWGGRGIKVCHDWVNDLVSFVEYLAALEGNDNPDLVLDRIDNDIGYKPGNLRFVTRSESQRNQRNHGGESGYYMSNRFVNVFKRLHDRGLSFKTIGELYCVQESTIRNCVRKLETGNALGS